MALPKRRHSKSRSRKRRTHWKITVPTVQVCPHCRQLKLAHHICPHCGYYNGRQVISVKEIE
ncbi:50S ribosomal protein L32 [bacterium]|nr:50S ribosomal protein L32 [bacterium]